MKILMSATPESHIPEAPIFVPRPAPSGAELLRDETWRLAQLPFSLVRGAGALLREARDARRELSTRARAVAEQLGGALRLPSETPLNREIGPHRRCDWLAMPIAEIKEVRKALGGSLNDVVLTVVTGAVRRFLERRSVDPRRIEFRVMAPVSVRAPDEEGSLGNRVSAWLIDLPLAEPDPRKQLRRIGRRTAELKEAKQAVGAEILTQITEWTPSTLLSLGARNGARWLPFNLVVTNVPGPQVPMYMLGARMLEVYPNVPLADHLGLGIALLSYDGTVYWGFNGDYDLLPDLDQFVRDTEAAFAELRSLAATARAAEKPGAPKPPKSRSARGAAPRANGAGAAKPV
jgi:diacylglycerol O-acyltransferase